MKASAREGKHSVTFSECQEIAKRVLAANKVTGEMTCAKVVV